MGDIFVMPRGGGGVTSDEVTATRDEVLVGHTALTADSNDEVAPGAMPNNGAVSQALNAGTAFVVPAGYHNGSGRITANTLASQTSATATPPQILTGQTAYVNGNKITGTMIDYSYLIQDQVSFPGARSPQL